MRHNGHNPTEAKRIKVGLGLLHVRPATIEYARLIVNEYSGSEVCIVICKPPCVTCHVLPSNGKLAGVGTCQSVSDLLLAAFPSIRPRPTVVSRYLLFPTLSLSCSLHPHAPLQNICPGVVTVKDGIYDDGYMQVLTGPWQGYELAVTRALGHKHMAGFGVLTEPHVVCLEAGPEDCCLVGRAWGAWTGLRFGIC